MNRADSGIQPVPPNRTVAVRASRRQDNPKSADTVRRLRWAAPLILSLAGLAVYANSFSAPWVFDGKDLIDSHISDLTRRSLGSVLGQTNRPLGVLSFAANFMLHGRSVWGYHVVNLTIHIVAAWLLFDIVRRTLNGRRLAERYAASSAALALAVALIWLVHPLQTQSVTYLYQRFESLMGMFFLLSLWCLIRGDGSSQPRLWYASAIASCLAAMGTKEVAAGLPVVLIWYDRALLASSWRDLLQRRGRFYAALAGILLLLGAIIVRSLDLYRGGGVLVVQGVSWLDYALTQPGVILHYLRLAVWPQGQCLDYGWPMANSLAETVVPVVLLGGLLAATVWCVFRKPAWGFLYGTFFVILAPTSSFFPIRDAAFEHRMYLPLATVAVAAVILAFELLNHVDRVTHHSNARRPAIAAVLLLVAVGALGTATVLRNRVHRSEVAIWSDTVTKAPQNPRAHNSLGAALAKIGEIDASVQHCRRALELAPDYAPAHYNLATALAESDPPAAIAHYRRTLESNPRNAKAHSNLGSLLLQTGDLAGAVEHLETALTLSPNMALAHNSLGMALARSDLEAAVTHYRLALEIDPHYADAHNNLAVALEQLGRQPEAIEHCRRAVALAPGSAAAHVNLARLIAQDSPQVAAEHYRAAIHLQPRLPQAYNGLAEVLARTGQLDEAVLQCRTALRLRPDYERARRNLSALLAMLPNEQGQAHP